MTTQGNGTDGTTTLAWAVAAAALRRHATVRGAGSAACATTAGGGRGGGTATPFAAWTAVALQRWRWSQSRRGTNPGSCGRRRSRRCHGTPETGASRQKLQCLQRPAPARRLPRLAAGKWADGGQAAAVAWCDGAPVASATTVETAVQRARCRYFEPGTVTAAALAAPAVVVAAVVAVAVVAVAVVAEVARLTR